MSACSWLLRLFLLILLQPQVAFAERVVIVRPEGYPLLTEVFNRVRGELRMRGFETVLVFEEGPTSQAELRRVAALGQADAAVAFEQVESEPTCHIWFADRESDRERLMSIAVPETEEAPTLLALRTVELLRSSLRERASPKAPPSRQMGAPIRPRAKASGRAPIARYDERGSAAAPLRYSFRLGGSTLWLASRRPASFAVMPSIAYGLTPHWAFAATAVFSVSSSEVETDRARGAVRADFLLGELRWLLARPHRLVRLELSAAAGVARCAARGDSRSDSTIQGRTASAWSMTLGAGGGVWFTLAPRWQFGVVSALGALLPEPVLRVERSDTGLGRPWFDLGAGIEYAIY